MTSMELSSASGWVKVLWLGSELGLRVQIQSRTNCGVELC